MEDGVSVDTADSNLRVRKKAAGGGGRGADGAAGAGGGKGAVGAGVGDESDGSDATSGTQDPLAALQKRIAKARRDTWRLCYYMTL